MGKLSGKVALVTGSSRGIGAAIAKRFAADGAKVVVNYANAVDAAEHVCAEIRQAGGEAIAVRGDVAVPEDVEHIFRAEPDGNAANRRDWAAAGSRQQPALFHRW